MNESAYVDIGLLRHGEAEGGACYRGSTDDALTVNGQNQMWAAVDDDCRRDHVVSSPLARCAAFARAFAQRHALSLRIDDRLREMDFGVWDGRTADDIMQTDAEALARFWKDPWTHGPPDGETLPQLRHRVLAAWRDIVNERRPVLVITHGGPIRLILCEVWGRPVAQMLDIDVPLASQHRVRVPVSARKAPSS